LLLSIRCQVINKSLWDTGAEFGIDANSVPVDLAYAVVAVYSPRQPILIPQTIASGILGLKSYSGG